jgi:hypothetical protein
METEGKTKLADENKSIAELIKDFEDEDQIKRDQATEAVVAQGEAAIEPLIQALKDQNLFVRLHSAIALSKLGAQQAIEPLQQALDVEDENSDFCLTATVALGRLGDEETIQYCLEGLEDLDSDERAGSAIALGLIGDKRAIDPLIRRVKEDPNNIVRCYAAAALAEIGDVVALPVLEEFERGATNLSVEGRRAKQTALEAIKSIKERNQQSL